MSLEKKQQQVLNHTTSKQRIFKGEVVSDKMDKTIVVRVDRTKVHPKYNKRYTLSRKYKVHDPKNQYQPGEQVKFIESRPFSKDKRWRVIYNQ